MANPDYEFMDGFDKYGPVGEVNFLTTVLGDWTDSDGASSEGTGIVASLAGSGYGYKLGVAASFGIAAYLTKTLPGNYARCIGGVHFNTPLTGAICGSVLFNDNASGQLAIGINSSGRIEVRRGAYNGTVIATSTEVVTANTTYCLEWNVTFHASAGIIKVWLNGVLTSINLTGQNTITTANAYANRVQLYCASSNNRITFDHFYSWWYSASGGSETPALTNPIIETQYPSTDSAVQFTPVVGLLGARSRTSTSTSSPAANSLVLRPFTAEVNCTINSVGMTPNTTSATVKMKAVIYADSGGSPGSLLSSGTEIVGTTAGTRITGALTSPQSLTAGTTYWIGFIIDTSIAWYLGDGGTAGYRAANTYTSGAPGTAPAMTAGQASFWIWGNLSGMGSNWPQVNEAYPAGDLSYNQSSTVNQEDLFDFPALSSTPSNIYTVAVKANIAKSDAGSRTVDMRTKSSSVSSSGSAPGVTPSATYSFFASYFRNDPNTGASWDVSALNAAKHGLKIAS